MDVLNNSTALSTSPAAQAGGTPPKPVAWIGFSLAVVGLIIGFFGLFNTHGSTTDLIESAIILTIPVLVVGLVLYSPSSFETPTKNGPSINAAVCFPLLSLFIANIYKPLENPLQPLLPAALIGAGLCMLALYVCKGSRPPHSRTSFVIMLTFIGAIGGYAGIQLADIHFDRTPGDSEQATVIGKREERGRRSTTYKFLLSPWGTRTAPQYVTVLPTIYDGVPVGGAVCVVIHSGFLGLPWYATEICK